ncbi:hypothetical protein D3C78_621220 [compost metagenome]
MVERHAFIGVVGQTGKHEQRLLADRQNTLLLRRHRHPRSRVGVEHADDIVTGFMHGTVDGVTRRIDLVRTVHQLVAGLIHLDQARRGNFVKHQPERVDQEIFGAGHLGGDMGEDQVIPAMLGDQAITGCQVDAGLPFGSTDLVFDTGWRLEGSDGHGKKPRCFYYGVFPMFTESSQPLRFV